MPTRARHVAVVEDDDELRERILLPLLRGAGFEASGHASALALYRNLLGRETDMVLVDIGLPDEDGFSIVRHLRSVAPAMRIVVLTGYGRDAQRARGLDAGADAYLVKPVDPAELLATLSILAGSSLPGKAQHVVSSDTPAWRLDASGWRLLGRMGAGVRLNLSERHVVLALASANGHAVTRESLIGALSDDVELFDPHRLEMLVHRLRRKCLQASGEPLPLATVRGVGYALTW